MTPLPLSGSWYLWCTYIQDERVASLGLSLYSCKDVRLSKVSDVYDAVSGTVLLALNHTMYMLLVRADRWLGNAESHCCTHAFTTAPSLPVSHWSRAGCTLCAAMQHGLEKPLLRLLQLPGVYGRNDINWTLLGCCLRGLFMLPASFTQRSA